MIKLLKKQKNSNFGFTLVETFVAIVILMIAVTGPMTLFSNSISDGVYAKNQVTASYLAQEGLELVINLRDSNIRNGNDWLNGLSVCTSGPCYFSDVGQTFSSCGGDCPAFNLNSATGEYFYDPSYPETIFSRYITIEEIGSGDEARVISEVHWRNKSVPKSFKVDMLIFDLSIF